MSCRRVQGSYRRIDIGHPAATKSSRNLYRRAADTGNFQHSLASSRGTPQGIGGPPIHFTGKKIRAWYRRPADTEEHSVTFTDISVSVTAISVSAAHRYGGSTDGAADLGFAEGDPFQSRWTHRRSRNSPRMGRQGGGRSLEGELLR